MLYETRVFIPRKDAVVFILHPQASGAEREFHAGRPAVLAIGNLALAPRRLTTARQRMPSAVGKQLQTTANNGKHQESIKQPPRTTTRYCTKLLLLVSAKRTPSGDQKMEDTTAAESVPLSVEGGSPDEAAQVESLDKQIIAVIEAAPHRTVRPARVAAELGISVNDACAELCGLLAAVGGGSDGASFTFENIDGQDVMVFQFPPDFAQRALRRRRYDDFWSSSRRAFSVGIRVLKIVTAFGLILSLLILCVAAIIGLVAVLVGLSRGENRGGGHRTLLMRQIRSLFFTIRQLLWFYAVFAPTSEGQDPFLREIAYDLSLVLSCCCGNPGSLFYWFRAERLARRRRGALRRWGRTGVMESDVAGVSLVREGSWGQTESSRSADLRSAEEVHRGILSIAVEFLFGPESASPDDASQVWKLRAAVIVNRSSAVNGVALKAFAPYLDYPPLSLQNEKAAVVEQSLMIVAHFNGIPNSASSDDQTDAEFVFPELMAESTASARYEHRRVSDGGGWGDFLCVQGSHGSWSGSNEIPEILEEERYRFTRMTSKQLSHCALLGILNLIGVLWLGQSVAEGGVLEVGKGSTLSSFLSSFLMPLLRGYALLFLVIPTVRLALLVFLNYRRLERNKRRRSLVEQLKAMK